MAGVRHVDGLGITATLDAHKAEIDAKLDALDSNLKMMMWMIGATVAVIGTLVRLFGWADSNRRSPELVPGIAAPAPAYRPSLGPSLHRRR